MGSMEMSHVCIPYPAQGHINPMLNLAKLLHHRGFHVTFVNTAYNHSRLLRSRDPSFLDGLPSFQFRTIPDGLPPSDAGATQDSTQKSCLPYLRDLLERLNDESATSGSPPVSCMVSDGVMSFTLDAAEAVGVPEVLFWTTSACGFMGYVQHRSLIDRDASNLTFGYLDTTIDWILGMRNIRLRDLPTFIQTTDPDDLMITPLLERGRVSEESLSQYFQHVRLIRHEVLDALKAMFPPIYTLGPLHLLTEQLSDNDTRQFRSNLRKEEPGCIEWLDSKQPGSIVYVNFGSITVMSPI
ncbi:hypothetical protein EUGRSUZ_F00352 [Eucalyptus grandis]|uniref:Uncharacterized protein n=2 Tax=Eucalyptus grandis TaxID=71139 RepID=A0ACC3KDD4_EUCGR|nr:hypothetical protein EUGRSUZ_F00352 [Eucalyptus grandis]